jgi:hypothetical protein
MLIQWPCHVQYKSLLQLFESTAEAVTSSSHVPAADGDALPAIASRAG